MPVDPRIPLGVQPPSGFNTPFQMLGQMAELRDMQQRRELQQQQIRAAQAQEEQRRQDIAEQQRQQAELARYRQLVSKNMPRADFVAAVQAETPGQIDAVMKRLGEYDEQAAKMEKLNLDVEQARRAYVGTGMEDIANSNYSPLVASAIMTDLAEKVPSWAPQIQQLRLKLVEGGPEALKAAVDRYRPTPKTREVETRDASGAITKQIVEDKPGQTFTSQPEPPKTLEAAIFAARNNPVELNRLLKLQRQEAENKRTPETAQEREERALRIKKLQQDLDTATKAGTGATTAKLEAVAPVIDEITTLAGKIFTSDAGPWTNIVGAWRSGAARMNLDNDVTEYRSLVRGFTPLMARAVGHNGVLTEQDVQRTELLFPEVALTGTDNATVAKNKLERMKRVMVGGGTEAEKEEVRRLMGWTGAAAPAVKPSGGITILKIERVPR
jgi:hypothetical protein